MAEAYEPYDTGVHNHFPGHQDYTPDTTIRKGIFPFLQLPAELRLQVYNDLIPNGFDISYDRMIELPVLLRREDGAHFRLKGGCFPYICTELFLVNRQLCNEARAILYGQNTYIFQLYGGGDMTYHLQSIQPNFGVLYENTHLVRHVRSISIIIDLGRNDYWAMRRVRSRLGHIIRTIKLHAVDTARRSLLKKLHVEFSIDCEALPMHALLEGPSANCHVFHCYNFRHRQEYRFVALETLRRLLFGLENLLDLPTVREVHVEGEDWAIPAWFARCLELCISSGDGNRPRLMDYPKREVRRKATKQTGPIRKGQYMITTQTTKQWFEPRYDWKEYAERNGIEIDEQELEISRLQRKA
ncbi:hypothetical protein BU24DRAFT_425568 [Aaosphaeria arxii CBS 175.79]|uniref:Uncharacterized protein n=1 Tax=Aaosphaeria arxii CBS 175.79 TaxID=1450172 RepID=A0A6A5XJE2_9PLEO|nr:uncharacterized protein BU24DRAFT_425568 [Aaosphaeria arxii CBS 175.79]KAF2012986.1 hypothetical protein BU24DRAFT_425568 [Aaosphaeria arxii CBS 175.79]